MSVDTVMSARLTQVLRDVARPEKMLRL